jgi:hypothetical protein
MPATLRDESQLAEQAPVVETPDDSDRQH